MGIGVDVVSIPRFRALRSPERVAAFYLREEEWERAQTAPDQATYLASRFAAKEAVIKASPQPLRPIDFSIEKDGVKPVVRFHIPFSGTATVSITHEADIAAAIAVVLP